MQYYGFMKKAKLDSILDLGMVDPQVLRNTMDKVRAENSLRDFAKLSASLVEPRQLVWGWHLDALCDHLQAVEEGHIRRLLVNVPPRSLKSTITSVIYPAWAWTKDPTIKFLTGSHGSDLAVRDTRKSRTIIESDWYKELWGDEIRLCADQNQKRYYENTKNGYRVAFSTGSFPMGKGGDRIILDDPLSLNAAWSKTKREGVNDMLGEGMFSRLNPDTTGDDIRAIIVIMQRLCVDDCTGYLLERFSGWEHLMLPLEFEPDRKCKTSIFMDPRNDAGESLCPALFPPEKIAELKEEYGPDGTAGQLQQRPNKVGGNLFDTDCFQTYYVLPQVIKCNRVIQGLDTAYKEKQRNDYSVCITLGESDTAYYILDVWRKKLPYLQLKAAIEELASFWKPYIMLIEDKASGQSLIQDLEMTTKLPVKAITPDGDKEYRANMAKPIIDAHRVWLPEHAGWRNDFIDEFAAFPKVPHDDQVDTLSMILNYIRATPHTGAPRVISWKH